MNETSVLLVDDEDEFVSALGDRLEARGLAVDTAENGEIALAKAQQRRFDAILLDMSMPGMDQLGDDFAAGCVHGAGQCLIIIGKGIGDKGCVDTSLCENVRGKIEEGDNPHSFH